MTTYYKDLDDSNVLHGNFQNHIQCPECEGFYPMDIFHNGLCDGCALDQFDDYLVGDTPNGIPF